MTLSLSPSTWVRCPRPLPQAQLRLFCLPYAGGDVSLFYSWPLSLPSDMLDHIEICPIQLPGNAHRIREPLFTDIPALINVLVPAELAHSPLHPFLDKPFAFLGMGLGGIISFEIARALDTRHQLNALALCVTGCRAPHLPGTYSVEDSDHLNDRDFVAQIHAHGIIPERMLSDEKHLRLILPKIRADVLMAATYKYIPEYSLDCPITICGGTCDALVSFTELAAWQAYTRRTFSMYTFPGDHLFLHDPGPSTRIQLLEYLARALREGGARFGRSYWPAAHRIGVRA